jgi:hypothetical protein
MMTYLLVEVGKMDLASLFLLGVDVRALAQFRLEDLPLLRVLPKDLFTRGDSFLCEGVSTGGHDLST